MKALGKLHRAPGLSLYDAPKPAPGPNDLLVRVKKAAICGTDVHIYDWDEWAQKTIPVPMTTGHEFFGIVESVGSHVTQFKPGDRVAGEGHLICSLCRNCRCGRLHHCSHTRGWGVNCTGAFAEYFAFPASNAILLPPEIPDTVAAILDPLGNATHTALSFDITGEDVLITGAGPIGIMAALIAQHIGARHVVLTDLSAYRLTLARTCGVHHTCHPSQLAALTQKLKMTEGFAVGFEMSGSPQALAQMVEALNHGGRIALLGILPDGAPLDWTRIIFKSLTIKGIYGREMYETWVKMIRLLQSGLDVSGVVTHTLPVDQFEQAFALIKRGECGKVVLEF